MKKFEILKFLKFKIAQVDPRGMLNNFCFHLYAQKSMFIAETCNGFELGTSSMIGPLTGSGVVVGLFKYTDSVKFKSNRSQIKLYLTKFDHSNILRKKHLILFESQIKNLKIYLIWKSNKIFSIPFDLIWNSNQTFEN